MVQVLFDVTRLFIRASLSSPTGIDRVTEAYLAWLIERPDVELIPICTWGGVPWTISLPRCEAILRRKLDSSVRGPGEGDDTWRRLVASLQSPAGEIHGLRAATQPAGWRSKLARYLPAAIRTVAAWRPARIPAGALYLNVSHFGLEQPRLLERLAARGARIVVMIHDLIPIEHPEFCSPRAAGLHRRRIDGVLDHATLIIANSAATAADVARYAASAGKPAPPTCVAPLGLEPAFLEPRLPPVLGAPYFVCVGTIEPRKNIAFILRVWRRLAERMGDRTPALVLVGQRGWENEWIMDHLERSPPVLRFVHEASGLNDDRLAALIGGACALLAPSLSEGFDLPVSEALVLGTPVIASDIPVHRELAAATQLIDPLDGPAWIEAITRATVERRPCAPTAGPGWKDHFDTVAEALGWARRASGEGGKAARVPAADARRA